MKTRNALLLTCFLIAPGAPAMSTLIQSTALDPAERVALRQLENRNLGDLRAAGTPLTKPISDADRGLLRSLESRELAMRRAGDLSLSNHQLQTILLVLGIILVLAILL